MRSTFSLAIVSRTDRSAGGPRIGVPATVTSCNRDEPAVSKPQRRPRSADSTAAEPSMSGGDGPAEGGRAVAGRDRSATAYTRLRELIVHGRLAPGSRIVETDV